jgi:hypothetical protein
VSVTAAVGRPQLPNRAGPPAPRSPIVSVEPHSGLLFAALIGGAYWFVAERRERQKRDSDIVEIPEFQSAHWFRSVTSGGPVWRLRRQCRDSVVTDY